MAKISEADEACASNFQWISHADLPLSCPTHDERIWDAHPRVYLPIEEAKKVVCPYCGTIYQLADDGNK